MPELKSLKKNLTQLKQNAYLSAKSKAKPSRIESVGNFFADGCRSLRFIFSEKENILFALLQLAVIGLGYYIWVEGLAVVPEEVWEKSDSSDSNDAAALIVLVWSFVCVGLVAYPLGLLTACMGASYMLRFCGRPSTIAECLKIVLPKSWTLWIFSWLDGWWTMERILERLPKKNDRTPLSVKLANEAVYQAWKISSMGFLPALLCGRRVVDAATDSLSLLRERFSAMAKLRIGYSVICWFFGIAAYVGFFAMIFVGPFGASDMETGHKVYNFYFLAGFPMLVVLTFIMLIFRPIYIISSCRIYAYYTRERQISINLPQTSSQGLSALVAFLVLAVITAVAFLYRDQLCITALLEG